MRRNYYGWGVTGSPSFADAYVVSPLVPEPGIAALTVALGLATSARTRRLA